MDAQLKMILCAVGAAVLLIVNLISFCLMAADKKRAKRGARRVPEKTLFLWAALFGGWGGVVGMYALRHKTRHWYFVLFFPLFAIVQTALVGYGAMWLLGL